MIRQRNRIRRLRVCNNLRSRSSQHADIRRCQYESVTSAIRRMACTPARRPHASKRMDMVGHESPPQTDNRSSHRRDGPRPALQRQRCRPNYSAPASRQRAVRVVHRRICARSLEHSANHQQPEKPNPATSNGDAQITTATSNECGATMAAAATTSHPAAPEQQQK